MANRLTQKRRKCIKTQNIFRERQEYSSLYTISSQSVLSVPSSEIMSRNIVPNQSNQNSPYRGLQHKGDFVENMQPQNFHYPKLPKDVSMELQQKVYSNSQKNCFNARSQFINDRFDDSNLENGNARPQYPKPYCPMHISANRYTSPQPTPKYAINRLEESYWATWKPKNVDAANPRQNFDHKELRPPPRCVATSMMAHECMAMFSQTKRRPVQSLKLKCCNEKPLQIIREPSEMHESNSSDLGTGKKAQSKHSKSKCSCCTCPVKNESDSDEEPSSKSNENLESSQEEQDKLYDEMYMDCERDLMNWISDYEAQREHEEMQDMERQLMKQELMRRFEEQAEHDRDSIRFQDEVQVVEINSQTDDLMSVQKKLFNSRESIGSEGSDQQKGAHLSPKHSEPIDPKENGPISSKRSSRNSLINQSKSEPNSAKQSPRKESVSSKQSSSNNQQKQRTSSSPKHSPRSSLDEQQIKGSNGVKQSQANEEELPVINPSSGKSRPTTPQRPLVQTNKNEEQEKSSLSKSAPDTKAIDSAEYSEPDFSIIKHTDSFIINSRRQKEDRPRKPQPKFLKLTKTTFSPPPVKGHTYPLKSALKKERTQTPMGFGRTLSPVSAKVKPPSKQNLPPYLLRHV